mgnify:CR=1 FL=1
MRGMVLKCSSSHQGETDIAEFQGGMFLLIRKGLAVNLHALQEHPPQEMLARVHSHGCWLPRSLFPARIQAKRLRFW